MALPYIQVLKRWEELFSTSWEVVSQIDFSLFKDYQYQKPQKNLQWELKINRKGSTYRIQANQDTGKGNS